MPKRTEAEESRCMFILAYSRNPKETARAFELGCHAVFTYNLDDMTDPSKTIYCITGAGFVQTREEALKHGYLNRLGEPMKESQEEYPIAINSPLYEENFDKRMQYLEAHTRWPYGIHVGGSCNLIEHCFPKNHMISSGYWCYGFEDTHYRDPQSSLSQYQVDVWEEVTNEMITKAQKTFTSLKMVTTAFRCPTPIITKRNSSMLLNGAEIWYMFKRLANAYPNWRNIFFDIFQIEQNKVAKADKFMDVKANIHSYNLRHNFIANCMGVSSVFGKARQSARLTDDAQGVGTHYQAYMTNCHGGVLIDLKSKIDTDKIKDKINNIKKLPI